jgi:hypothetical protein
VELVGKAKKFDPRSQFDNLGFGKNTALAGKNGHLIVLQ